MWKARLVIKGCSQRKGFDYDEVYAPVARITTVRTLLALINTEDLHSTQMDVKNAFLHGQLEEEIYMKQPQGLRGNPELVCKLNKTLYGKLRVPEMHDLTSLSRDLDAQSTTSVFTCA